MSCAVERPANPELDQPIRGAIAGDFPDMRLVRGPGYSSAGLLLLFFDDSTGQHGWLGPLLLASLTVLLIAYVAVRIR